MNVKIRKNGNPLIDLVSLPIASATTVAVGDLISLESNLAVKLDAAAEDATFIGVSQDQSIAGETDDITIATKAIVEATVASAAYSLGAGLKYNTGGFLDADGGANTIAWAAEETKGVSVTTLKVLIDVVALGKLFAVSA